MSDLTNLANVHAFGCGAHHPRLDVVCHRGKYHGSDHRGPDGEGRVHEWPDPTRLEAEKRTDELWDEAHHLEDVEIPALATLQRAGWPAWAVAALATTMTLQFVLVVAVLMVLARL